MTIVGDAAESASAGIATPRGSSALVSLLSNQWLQETAARVGARLAALWGSPLRFKRMVFVARHAQVMEVLLRDLDFVIAPVNADRIDEVNGPFVLGMDRSARLEAERRALYGALRQVDLGLICRAVADRAAAIVSAATAELDVVGSYARPVASSTARSLFGIAGSDPQTFEDVARSIFAHTFLNVSGDETVRDRALRAAELMRKWFDEEIARRRAAGEPGSDMMGFLLRDTAIGSDLIRRTLGGMLVGSIDTTATAVAKIVAVIGKNAELAAAITADVDDEARLAGWCREALRRWPHNPVLLRRSAVDTTLDGKAISAGDDIILWTHAAMFDETAFPEPLAMRPDRTASSYLHFGGGLHPCAGRAVNAFQIPLLVGALIRRGVRSVGGVEWAGPFPDRLIVHFRR